jgi:hypothetical protein
MLDANSLEIITRFNQAVLSKKIPVESTNIARRNRGSKLSEQSTLEGLTTKVVEYNGVNHLVMTNDNIERSNERSKRNFYRNHHKNDDDDDDNADDEDEDADEEPEETDEHPFKKIKIADVLAPLNHPSELISHPAICRTYKLPIFNKLATELIGLIEIEQNTLNHLNSLLQVLNGEDWYYLLEDNLGLPKYDHGLNIDEKDHQSKQPQDDMNKIDGNVDHDQNQDEDGNDNQDQCQIEDGNDNNHDTKESNGLGEAKQETNDLNELKHEKIPDLSSSLPQTLGSDDSGSDQDPFFALPQALKDYESFNNRQQSLDDDPLTNLKLELINYLQASIQRQYEYIKNLSHLRNGIVRADRLKRDLYKWGKEMYDKKSV